MSFFVGPSFANAPFNVWWQKANNHYQQKNYDSAIVYYQKITAYHPENAVVYYNLGNAYYKQNNIGHAVLNYARALRIDPNCKKAEDNLILTQNRITNRIQKHADIFFVKWWKAITRGNLSNIWSIISLMLFLITLLILALNRWRRIPEFIATKSAIFLSVVCVGTLILSYISANRKVNQNCAVVIQQDAIMKETASSAKTLSLIPEGTIIKIENIQNGWASIKLPDGREGWVNTSVFEKI